MRYLLIICLCIFSVVKAENTNNLNNLTVMSLDELKKLSPNMSKKVYVKELQQTFTYTPTTTELSNNITVIGKWVMDKPDAYKASWFAIPNVKSSQATNLQKGYDYATSKSTPFIIDGVYFVDGRAQKFQSAQNGQASIILRSNSVLNFEPNSQIKVIGNNYGSYTILVARGVSNVNVNNLKLDGDRIDHKYTKESTHEWGYGLAIYDDTNNININQSNISNMTGDGIYIGREWGSQSNSPPKNINITDVKISKVRRNAITLSAGENIKISRPDISDISLKFNGVAPSAAIDIEPEEEEEDTELSSIKNCIIDSLIATRVNFPLQLNLTKSNRTVDVKFTGITKLIDSQSDAVIFAYDKTQDSNSTKGKIVIDNLVVSGSGFTPNISLKQNNFYFNIKKLEIENDLTIFMIGNVSDVSKYNGFAIDNVKTSKGAKAIYNFDYAEKKPKVLSKPNYKVNFPVSLHK